LPLAITALAIDLIWGYTGLLSLGQGIFFALGGYAAAMYLTLNTPSQQGGNGIPKFFENFGVSELPFFWQPFNSPFLTPGLPVSDPRIGCRSSWILDF